MVSIFSFGFKNRSSTSCFYFCLSCLWCLVACDQPEPIEPPSFPYDQATIEEAVLSPTGDLLTLDPERVGALVVATASVEGQSAQLFMGSILDILDSVSMLEETSEQGLTVVQHALHGESPLRRVRHAIRIVAQANAWVEIQYECGVAPGAMIDGGSVSLTVFASTESGVSELRPVGVAWGTASECTLSTDDSDTVIDGDFALVLPEGDAPTLFKFVGTQTDAQMTELDYEGYVTEMLTGIVVDENSERYTVATSRAQVLIHDCHGQWSCQPGASRCAYTADANDGFVSTCPAPNVSEVTW